MNEMEVLQVLETTGAIERGHFLLSSGRHSDTFVQKFRVLEHPRLTQRFGQDIAELFGGAFDLVASPAVGAIVLGFATALAAEKRMIFAERSGGRLELRRGFAVRPRERTLVVEDVITTGGSAAEVIGLVKAAGGDPVGVGALVDRGERGRPSTAGVPVRALLHLEAPSWEPEECGLCRRGLPLVDPGSSRLP